MFSPVPFLRSCPLSRFCSCWGAALASALKFARLCPPTFDLRLYARLQHRENIYDVCQYLSVKSQYVTCGSEKFVEILVGFARIMLNMVRVRISGCMLVRSVAFWRAPEMNPTASLPALWGAPGPSILCQIERKRKYDKLSDRMPNKMSIFSSTGNARQKPRQNARKYSGQKMPDRMPERIPEYVSDRKCKKHARWKATYLSHSK